MSNFTKEIDWVWKFFCLDDFFWGHRYWYVLMTENEAKSNFPWSLLEFSKLETRGWDRKVYDWVYFCWIVREKTLSPNFKDDDED